MELPQMRLFVQSEAKPENFEEMSRRGGPVLLASTLLFTPLPPWCKGA